MSESTTEKHGSLWTRFKCWFLEWQRGWFVPVRVSKWEWFILRLLFAGAVYHTFLDWHPYVYDSQPRPTGIARFVSLTFLNHENAYETMKIIVGITCLVYVSGFGLLASLPVLTLCSTLVRTYANSQGFTHHGLQIVTLTLLAQTLVVWYLRVWEWKHKRKWEFAPGISLGSYMLYYCQGVILATYVISVVTKMIKTYGLWIWNARYICIELIKSHRSEYYKYLDPKADSEVSMAVWLLNHPLAATALFGSGFFLEMFALLGLRNRLWALGIGLALIAMHESISVIMRLTFRYNEMLLLVFLVNIPYWCVWAVRRAIPSKRLQQ